MSVEIEIDTNEYEILIAHTATGVKDISPVFALATGDVVKNEMERVVPVKTGKLKRSIRLDAIGDGAVVSTNSGYGLFVDQPTKPHIIRAVNAQFLRIPLANGTIIFRKQVFHTGTKGHFFRRKTLQRASTRIKEVIQNKLNEAISL